MKKYRATQHASPDDFYEMNAPNYFNVTLAPSASNLVLISSASSLLAPSLTIFGAASTRSLASFRPRPVASRTTLMTLTLFGPTSVNSTSNSVFSSPPAAPASPPAAAATTTPAAADTPNSSSQASLCLYTRAPISNRSEETFAHLRYSLGGDRPSQTACLPLSPHRFHGTG